MRFIEFAFVPEDTDRPIKIVYENDGLTEVNDCTIEYTRKLSPMELEKLFRDMFGTTNVGMFDCSDISDEEFNEFIDKWNNIPKINPISPDELRKALKRAEDRKERGE